MSQNRNNELLDNYLLFIHNIQVQQSNITTLNNTIHNALHSLVHSSLENEQVQQYRRSTALNNMPNWYRRNNRLNPNASPIYVNRTNSTTRILRYQLNRVFSRKKGI